MPASAPAVPSVAIRQFCEGTSGAGLRRIFDFFQIPGGPKQAGWALLVRQISFGEEMVSPVVLLYCAASVLCTGLHTWQDSGASVLVALACSKMRMQEWPYECKFKMCFWHASTW